MSGVLVTVAPRISGLVPVVDIVFPAFTSACLIILARFAFPSHGTNAREIFHGSRLFRMYVILGTTIGLFLPLAYVLGGFARGDDHSWTFFVLPPVRALVLLLYTVRRLFVIADWVVDVWLNKTLPANAPFKDMGHVVRLHVVPRALEQAHFHLYKESVEYDVVWYWFGKILATADLVYFSINLFVFLIPKFLPRSFERYFMERNEIYSKAAEDKGSATGSANKRQTTDEESKKAD
ncbi:hypothetical protein IFM89_039504 [Coptis chinensis]|uniref:DUF7733 domain-containing protein n=1 Tax=Coptis chinensis TaxID=261450 RepID=A0A835LCA9_9MAGN|nr:hypothetical protein IFM89_039504 [Coptis chinensis]